MSNRLPAKHIKTLREIRDFANYVNAGGFTLQIGGSTYGPFGRQVVEAIKDATRVYRESWINPKIDALLAWAERRDADV